MRVSDDTEGLAVDEHLQQVLGGVDGELQPLARLEELLALLHIQGKGKRLENINEWFHGDRDGQLIGLYVNL